MKKIIYKSKKFKNNNNNSKIKIPKLTRNYLKINYFYESLKPYFSNNTSDKKYFNSKNELPLSEKKKI